jgi:cytoskeletal protein RodZ
MFKVTLIVRILIMGALAVALSMLANFLMRRRVISKPEGSQSQSNSQSQTAPVETASTQTTAIIPPSKPVASDADADADSDADSDAHADADGEADADAHADAPKVAESEKPVSLKGGENGDATQ